LVAGEPDELHRVAQRLHSEFGTVTEVVFSADFLLEVNAAGTNKGWGLCALAEALDVPIEQTVAFGDNFNDVPLIKAAGLGVAMGNAVPELLAAADLIAPTCYDDGFADVASALFLRG
jgi:hydroxymethylpyrimidine pyrophosphatase-like HAD family hydrolase